MFCTSTNNNTFECTANKSLKWHCCNFTNRTFNYVRTQKCNLQDNNKKQTIIWQVDKDRAAVQPTWSLPENEVFKLVTGAI